MKNKLELAARGVLLLAAMIWGGTFVVLKNTIDSIPFCEVLAIRFSVAFLLLSAIFHKKLKNINKEYIWQGAIIGLCLFLAYYTQTIGLKYTTPGKNAFLTAFYCVMAPFLFWIVKGSKPAVYNLVATVVAVAGIGLVSLDGRLSIGYGDGMTLVGGFFYAAHIVAVSCFAKKKDPVLITVIQFFFCAVFNWSLSLMTEEMTFAFSLPQVGGIAFLAVCGTGAALLLQNVGQKYTNPSAASILLSLESVFGVMFSLMMGAETLSIRVASGFLLIFVAVIISETGFPFKKKSE